MIQRIKRALSTLGWAKRPVLGWAVCAAMAGIGTAINAPVYGALMAASTVFCAGCAMVFAYRSRGHLRYLQHMTETTRRHVILGRRARWVLLTVKDKDGSLYAASLAQILNHITPEHGGDMLWDTPEAAALYYMDPDGLYAKAEHGDAP